MEQKNPGRQGVVEQKKSFLSKTKPQNASRMKASLLQKQVYETKVNTPGFIHETARVRKIRKLLGEMSPRRVLDVGCGDGAILAPLLQRHELFGVDISEEGVRHANAAGIKAKQHDLEDPLPFDDASFDTVFCGETIEHQIDTDWLLSEMNRVLKPGGQLILTYPNIRTPLGIFMLVFMDMPPMYSARYRSPHFRDFTLLTIKIALRNNGFQLSKAWGCYFILPVFGACGSALASILPWFSSAVLVLAQKTATTEYHPEKSIGEIFK